MKKVITYGTYDLLHYGHIRLLERAKALGDYLIVGVTAEDFDKARGKINVEQSLMDRIEAVRQTGLADEIIVEEYEGQKIDDIQRYDVDIFAIGSDWLGKFDYLNEYCEVVYLDRTQGVSSTELRSSKKQIRLGMIGSLSGVSRYAKEASFVNGINISAVCCTNWISATKHLFDESVAVYENYEDVIEQSDAIYVVSHPSQHFEHVKNALEHKKHVLCESPISLSVKQTEELFNIAKVKGVVLMDSIKTAFSMAYDRLVLLVKGGKIGDVVSVDATCTSMTDLQKSEFKDLSSKWNSICAWGPTALLPIMQILGPNYCTKQITTNYLDKELKFDRFTKISFVYPHAVASVKVGKGIKSEGELVISGTKGYVYVPAPWWKTDYFEIRYEDQSQNKRYFYQLDGDGIRYELVSFVKSIQPGKDSFYIQRETTDAIVRTIEDYYKSESIVEI